MIRNIKGVKRRKINLTINDKLLYYISKEEGVYLKCTPSSFILNDVGISIANLDIAIY